MKNKRRNYNQKKTKPKRTINYIFWIVLALFVAGTVFFTIETATLGAEIARLEQVEASIIEENRQLSDRLVSGSSLMAIEENAQELGFFRPDHIVYITEKEALAKLPF